METDKWKHMALLLTLDDDNNALDLIKTLKGKLNLNNILKALTPWKNYFALALLKKFHMTQ